MIGKDDFYLKTESREKIKPKKNQDNKLLFYRLEAKDPELDEGPFKVMSIIRYLISFELYGDMYADII